MTMVQNGSFPRQLYLFLLLLIVLAAGLSMNYYITSAQQPQTGELPADTHMYIILLEGQTVVQKMAESANPVMNLSSLSAQRAQRTVQAQQALVIDEMTRVVERPLSIPHQYTHAINGMAVELTAAEAAILALQPDIRAVVPSQARQPLTDSSPSWIGAHNLWDGSQTGGIAGTQGEGIIIGIIDTGINLDHPSFAAVGGDGYVHTNPNGTGNYLGKCATQPDITICNDKLIGAYSWPEVGDNPEDDYSHGSNVAGIAAGNIITVPLLAPTIVLTPTFSGIAPHATIIAYDVCQPAVSCPDELSIAAIEQAILDGVDVLNFSIGGAASNPWTDPLSLAFLSAREAGIFVATAVGNSGAAAGTISAPSNSPWMTSVGNVTGNGRFDNILTPLSGGLTTLAPITGASTTGGYGSAPIVSAAQYTTTGTCAASFPPDTWHGEIVFCEYSNVNHLNKVSFVQAGGAGGIVIGHNKDDVSVYGLERLNLPGVTIGASHAAALSSWLASGSNHMAEIQGTVRQHDASYADELYISSSRGPALYVPDILKPNLSAPGVLIWAAGRSTDTSTPPEFSFYRGTSQASPHVAGSAALLMVLHPDWTPAEIESALMMTTVSVHLDDTSPAGVFDAGSGRVDLTAVSRVGFVLDETASNFRAANPVFGQDLSQLNLASLTNATCATGCIWTRELRSTLATPTSWTIDITQPITAVLSVQPTSFTLQPGATQIITVTAVANTLPLNIWDFGDILFTETTAQAPNTHLPVAANFSNAAPIADAGDDQTVTVNQLVTLDGSGSSDKNIGQTLSYGWVQTGGPVVSLSDTTAVSPTFIAPANPTTLTYTLTVTDNYGLSNSPSEVVVTVNDMAVAGLAATNSGPTTLGQTTYLTATLNTGSNISYSWDLGDAESGSGATISHLYDEIGSYTATVTVTNSNNSQTAQTIVIINDAPTADAGGNQTVFVNQLVTLDGSNSADNDPAQTLSYGWMQTGGPAVSLSDTTVVNPTFTAFHTPTILTFTLTVTDSYGLPSLPSDVVVTVNDSAVDGLEATNSSPTALGQNTYLTATLSTGSNISYSWDFGDGQSGSGATISHLYGEIGSYTATVTATNSSNSQTVKTIVIINELPLADAGSTQVVKTNEIVTLDGSGSMDADGHLPLHFSWTQTAGSVVVLNDVTAVTPTFTAPANQTNLTFTLIVTDSLGLSSLPSMVMVSVQPYTVFLPIVVK